MVPIVDGILETTINSWDELPRFTRYFSDDMGFIFRGQADSEWPLMPSLERYMHTLPEGLQNDTIYPEHLKNFKNSLQGRGINHMSLSENELWALGQHYGLFTPLLDWTYSFHIALYFTFIEDYNPKNGFRAIYAIHKQMIEQRAVNYNIDKPEYNKFEVIESINNENPRVINQAGLFTKMPFKFNLRNWSMENNDCKSDEAQYIKICIPNKERMRILKELNLMNINPKIIYPDLHGASLNCNHILALIVDKAILEMPPK